jgi:anti-sigma-K factor RskA
VTCEEVDELLPAFALHALTDEDARAVSAHLATCDRHAEAMSLRATATALTLAAEERDAPSALRGRILATVTDAAPSPARPPASAPVSLRSRRVTSMWAQAAALAAAILVAAVALWQSGLLTRSDEQLVASATSGSVSGEVVYRVDAERAELTLSGLPAPGAGRDIQAWVIRPGDDPVPAGIVSFEGSTGRLTIDARLQAGDTVAVTDEPQGGSAQPTSAPLLAMQF